MLEHRARDLVGPQDGACLAPVDEVAQLDAPVLHRVRRELARGHLVEEVGQVPVEAPGHGRIAGHAQRPGLLARARAHCTASAAGTYDGFLPLAPWICVLASSGSQSSGTRTSAGFAAD